MRLSRFSQLLIVSLMVSGVSFASQAQTPEEYYKNKAQKMRDCGGDTECAARVKAEGKSNAAALLTGESTGSEQIVQPLSDAEEKFKSMSMDELLDALKRAEIFYELDTAKTKLDSPALCGKFKDKAKETRDALDQLNQQVTNRTTENYGRQAQEYKDANTLALKNLDMCYADQLPSYALLKANNITSYAAHSSEYNNRVGEYATIPNIYAHILDLKEAIENRSKVNCSGFGCGAEAVAVVASIYGKVEILVNGRGTHWKAASKGQRLHQSDELRTGPDARARLVFSDRYKNGTAGPTVVNVGSNTHIRMEQFTRTLDDPPKATGVIGLVRGALRAFTKGWGFRSSFQVRTGSTICGIRGTEVAVSYNPDTNVAEYHLDHGDAYVESNGTQTTMAPRTSRTISNGVVSEAKPLTDSGWNSLVTSTGDGVTENMTRANESYGTLFTTGTLQIENKTSVKEAENLTEQFLKALQTNDQALLDRTIAGLQKDKIVNNQKDQTLKAWLDGNKQRPRHYVMKCHLCESSKCELLTYVETEADMPGAGKDMLFVTEGGKLTESYFTPDRLSAFRLKGPICKK